MRSSRFRVPVSDEDAIGLYWVIPQVLAGMPMPMFDLRRRERPNLPAEAFPDDLPVLRRVGIRAVVCMLHMPAVVQIYAAAGIACHLMPIPDGDAPSLGQFLGYLQFVDEQRALGNPVAAHCAAGLGRTGTVLAGYLIAQGEDPEIAIRRVRQAQPGAIETSDQVRFLRSLPKALAKSV